MTTLKLHPAAVKAAEADCQSKSSVPIDSPYRLSRVIHAAIEDHFKSEGWEELREAADAMLDLYDADSDVNRRLLYALRRVRDVK